ncbi:GNAT family N-acetyltransferase [Anianabacter salinae]|uniref:GNAT family N-acetyltransferase n=1 Tax=Anianabacter salinae TaxID=2851023 RepID=UPI00225DFBC7|nr:GNAT family N-acetyltransferase [Anianabacter salinae]MBV0913297.1 GNAT family N-acetyltransferase [Anianabacter salinae]
MDATWCAARQWRDGPWTIRDGQGGGKRVSAATAEAPWTAADINTAETAMRALGQAPLFRVSPAEQDLDTALAARGYVILDPVVIYAMPVAKMAAEPIRRVSAFQIWPPLAIMRDLWAEGGIGPDRIAVMDRVAPPKTSILARERDRPAGVAFVARDGGRALIHAIEVTPELRRAGVGRNILRMACHWAAANGADWLGLAVTRANEGANALYASLGMVPVEQYHYRQLPE